MDNFYMLADLYCYKFSDKIHNYEECSFFDYVEEHTKTIKDLLKDEDKEIVDRLKNALDNCFHERNVYNIADALNYGIKIGMELQEYIHSLIE